MVAAFFSDASRRLADCLSCKAWALSISPALAGHEKVLQQKSQRHGQ